MKRPQRVHKRKTHRVGVRAFRAELRRWLDAAAAGDEVVITDRGTAVARLSPATEESTLERLIAEGVVTPADRPVPERWPFEPVRARGTVSDIVIRDRR